MEAEWAKVVGGGDLIPEWNKSMTNLASEHARLVREGHWRSGPADFLAVLNRSYRETYHSLVIAWLCRPEGHHGLGDRFLRHLLAACGPDAESLLDDRANSPVQVATEVPAGSGQVDIVITTHGGPLVIENKTGSPEGKDQLLTYHQALDDGTTVFVFLTPTGNAPTSAGNTAGDWKLLSYPKVAAALRQALKECDDPPGRAVRVASSYLDCLEAIFP